MRAGEVMIEQFIWPSDADRAENDELNRVCEYAEHLHDELEAARHAPASGEVEPVMELDISEDRCFSPNLIDETLSLPAGHYKLYTHPPAKVPESELIDHIDLMADEFKRIKALNPSPEIIDLCERALRVTEQNVPVLKRVEKLEKCISSLLWENSELKERLATTATPATTAETEWVKCAGRLPKLGQRVQLFSQGVVQHHMPIFDEDDEGIFWDFEIHDYNPPVDFERDQWRLPPTPPQEQ